VEPLARFSHVALTVADLDRSADFYSEVLGMVEQFRENSPTRRAAVYNFEGGGKSIGLVEHIGSRSDVFDPTVTGLDHLALSVGSQDASLVDPCRSRKDGRGKMRLRKPADATLTTGT
jgi:catechol 2,3-dioxygenase-like lactoylglutathione lyase family enzyme